MSDVRDSPLPGEAAVSAPAGWQTAAPREEIRPRFAFDPEGGPDGRGAFVIEADAREGLDGYWTKAFPITGGSHYRFCVHYRALNVAVPRRSVVVKIDWRNAQGEAVSEDQPTVAGYLRGMIGRAETEHPTTKATDAEGWTEVSDTYCAPSAATQAVVELHLQWAAEGAQ